MVVFRTLIGIIACASAGSPAIAVAERPLWHAAQPEGAAQPAASALAGQIELARLVDLAAERLKLQVEYDAAALRGTVTLRLGGEITDAELWDLTNRVLASRGFTTVRMPGSDVISVVKIADAPGLARLGAVIEGGQPPAGLADPGDPGFTSVVIRLRHRAPKDVLDAVTKVLSKPSGAASALGDTTVPRGLIIISDLTPRIEQALELVALIDVSAGRVIVEEVPAVNVPADRLATLAAQLVAKRDAVSGEKLPGEVLPAPSGESVVLVAPADRAQEWKDLLTSLDRRERTETVTYTPTVFGAKEVGDLIEQTVRGGGGAGSGEAPQDDRWRLVVDELTGTLIITATPTEHEAVRALMERLEATPREARRPVRTFVIRNRDVREMADVLRSLVQAGVLAASVERAAGGEAKPIVGVTRPPPPPGLMLTPPGDQTPPSREGGALLPRSDAGSLPRGPEDGTGAEAPITLTIDEGTSTIIAMGEPRLLEQLAALIEQLDVRQAQVMLEVLMVSLTEGQTLTLGVELEALDLSGDTLWRVASLFGLSTRGSDGAPSPTGAGRGLTGVVLNPGDFSVVLRALKTVNDGRSLSMPKVLVGNNQQATLDSVLEQPFQSTNASNTVATTSFGGSSAAGTQVSIRPQIAEGDHLILDYQISLSSFAGAASDPALPPPKQTNKLASVATIPDGFTIAVGGIDLINESKNVSKVPFIARVPLVGELFKNRSWIDNRTRFYVFIRANVLRSASFEELKYLSARDATDAGVDDGFPDMAPRVIR